MKIMIKLTKKQYVEIGFIGILAIIAFIIRVIPYKTVFTDAGIGFTTNDAWYHMRTVGFLLANYPTHMVYNPLTNYPYGGALHFGVLFDQMIAIPALILGLGNPSAELISAIGALLPAVLGALVVIPVYYIGKQVYGERTAILSATFITLASGQFLSRSMIGFTDHHIAEVLFSTLFIMFFMRALTAGKVRISEEIKVSNYESLKKVTFYSILAGASFAAYQLAWVGAALFILIIGAYVVIQYSMDAIKGRNSKYLELTGMITFGISAILILPFVELSNGFSQYFYSQFHVIVPLGAGFGIFMLNKIKEEMKKRDIEGCYYPVVIFGLGIIGLIFTKVALPSIYALILETPAFIFAVQTGGASTIAEASSMFYLGETFTLSRACSNFTVFAFISSGLMLIVLGIGAIFRSDKHEVALLFVWSAFILMAMYGQNRFAYYYSVNVAVLCALFCSILLKGVKFDTYLDSINGLSFIKDAPKIVKSLNFEQFIILFIIVGCFIYPMIMAVIPYTAGNVDPDPAWKESCEWLGNNTPDIGMDFNGVYEAPEYGTPYEYPDTAYGVMSWWDYGHYIEIFAHRIPNANPFQAGIGGRGTNETEENKAGAASFFTSSTEEEATAVLEAVHPAEDKAGARYIMSDANMAMNIFMAMAAWTRDTEGYYQEVWTGASGYQYVPSKRYFDSMEARLHILDGNGLTQYRLIHESMSYTTQEMGYKQVYNYLYGGNLAIDSSGYVKTFEYVKGAKVTGTVTPNEKVIISVPIKTNQGRTFVYSQETTSDASGKYIFVVPYSTTGSIEGETRFDTMSTGSYTIKSNGYLKMVNVSESAVLYGEPVIV
jgi:dolichyl-diphosphooligosaccharide--protein glycosyltransferase